MIPIKPSSTLVVFALEAEARSYFDKFVPVYTGIGKVNAAYRLTRRIAEWRANHGASPQFVLNLGSAGSSRFKKGEVVNCTSFVQRDFDATAFGCDPFTTPFDVIPATLKNGHRFDGFAEGVCGTGDNFVTDMSAALWNVVDMEAYALAKACYIERIPFGCLKYITDGADGHAASTWEDGLEDAADSLRRAVDKIFAV